MKTLRKILTFLFTALLLLASCEEIKRYPDEPTVEFESFNLYQSQDALGNTIYSGELSIRFTDGDGDIGMGQPDSLANADSLKYNLFLKLWTKQNNKWIPDDQSSGLQNFRIPYIKREGQNKTLSGTITVSLEYKTIDYDTIRYTFYLMDRQFNRSNVDTTDEIIFTGLEL